MNKYVIIAEVDVDNISRDYLRNLLEDIFLNERILVKNMTISVVR